MSSNEKYGEPILKKGDKVTRAYADANLKLCGFDKANGADYMLSGRYVYTLAVDDGDEWTCVGVRLDSYAQYGEEINMLKNRK
jgi:hypothetical protein